MNIRLEENFELAVQQHAPRNYHDGVIRALSSSVEMKRVGGDKM